MAGAVLAYSGQAHAGTGGATEAISVSPSTVEAGAQITIVGTGWFCAADIDLYIDLDGLSLIATVPFADLVDNGFTITTPAPDSIGDYDVIAEYGDTQTSTSCVGQAIDRFTVVPSSTTSTTTSTTTAPSSSSTTSTTTAPSSSSTTSTTTATTVAESTTTVVVDNNAATTTVAADGGPVSTLPVTGGSSGPVAPYALLLVALGGMLVLVARRTTTN